MLPLIDRLRWQPPAPTPPRPVAQLMRDVLLALVPGLLIQWWQFGVGVPIQIGLCAGTAVLTEAAMLRLRGRASGPTLRDHSALVTALLLALSLPPLAPWWVSVIGATFAMVFGKHLYGGLGHNPFNPAMLGYAVLMVSFPKAMTFWPGAAELQGTAFGVADSVAAIFRGLPDGWIDALARATPLTAEHDFLITGTRSDAQGTWGWRFINLGFGAGGLWLLHRRVIDRRLVLAFLAAVGLIATTIDWALPGIYPGAAFHLFSGSTLLAAFFIVTDPVTAATTPWARWLYGAGIGALVVVIRSFGGYPDGVAFAVLLMNVVAPTLDRYTRGRVYGH